MNSKELKLTVIGSVYPPSEDSYLLAKHAPTLKGRILDMCTGSGVCALENAKANPENVVIGVDVNPESIECATKNAEANNIRNVEFIQSDLFEKVDGTFNGIICNPPYLPDFDLDQEAEIALSGGKTGREFTDSFLNKFGDYLKKDGVLLLLQSSINDLELTQKKANEIGFSVTIIDQDEFFFEKLFVLKFSRVS